MLLLLGLGVLVLLLEVELERELLAVGVPLREETALALVDLDVGDLEPDRLVRVTGEEQVLPRLVRLLDALLEGRHEPVPSKSGSVQPAAFHRTFRDLVETKVEVSWKRHHVLQDAPVSWLNARLCLRVVDLEHQRPLPRLQVAGLGHLRSSKQ